MKKHLQRVLAQTPMEMGCVRNAVCIVSLHKVKFDRWLGERICPRVCAFLIQCNAGHGFYLYVGTPSECEPDSIRRLSATELNRYL